MDRITLKELPRYECLAEAAKSFPDLDPAACEAFLHLMRASDDVWRVVDGYFASHGTTQGRFVVMMLLMRPSDGAGGHPRTPAEIANLAQVSRATVTGLLDSLERDGFVRREPDLNDRRMLSVCLTEDGAEFVNRVLPKYFRIIRAMMSRLKPSEFKTLAAC